MEGLKETLELKMFRTKKKKYIAFQSFFAGWLIHKDVDY